MATEPSHHRLIEHELDVLVPRETERHDKTPGSPRPGAEIDLCSFCRRKQQRHRDIRRHAGADAREHATHGGIATAVAVLAAQRCMDGDAANALAAQRSTCPRYGSTVEIVLRARRAWPTAALIAASSGNGRLRCQPTLRSRQRTECSHLGPSHQPSAGNVAIRIALA